MKKTVLYEMHLKAGAKLIDFNGFLLPVSYDSIIKEHEAVRNACGIFDVSHMGEILVSGDGAAAMLDHICTNRISSVPPGAAVYSCMCYPDGGTVDDLIIYRLSEKEFFCVVNASNTDKDHAWMIENNITGAEIINKSEKYAQIAIQGPLSETVVKAVFPELALPAFFRFIQTDGMLISRTGYTGEDGFEIYLPNENAETLWNALLEKGAPSMIRPAGLGARDTLRFEACLPLYGHELSSSITPIEAGLSKFIRLDKDEFIGKEALLRQASGKHRVLTGLKMVDRGIPRQGYSVESETGEAGFVTSGSFCPTLDANLALALVNPDIGTDVDLYINIRGNRLKTERTSIPFYNKKYRKRD